MFHAQTMVQRSLTVPGTNLLQQMHLYGAYVMDDGFLREEGLLHKKVPDARVNAVDPLAPCFWFCLGSTTQRKKKC